MKIRTACAAACQGAPSRPTCPQLIDQVLLLAEARPAWQAAQAPATPCWQARPCSASSKCCSSSLCTHMGGVRCRMVGVRNTHALPLLKPTAHGSDAAVQCRTKRLTSTHPPSLTEALAPAAKWAGHPQAGLPPPRPLRWARRWRVHPPSCAAPCWPACQASPAPRQSWLAVGWQTVGSELEAAQRCDGQQRSDERRTAAAAGAAVQQAPLRAAATPATISGAGKGSSEREALRAARLERQQSFGALRHGCY